MFFASEGVELKISAQDERPFTRPGDGFAFEYYFQVGTNEAYAAFEVPRHKNKSDVAEIKNPTCDVVVVDQAAVSIHTADKRGVVVAAFDPDDAPAERARGAPVQGNGGGACALPVLQLGAFANALGGIFPFVDLGNHKNMGVPFHDVIHIDVNAESAVTGERDDLTCNMVAIKGAFGLPAGLNGLATCLSFGSRPALLLGVRVAGGFSFAKLIHRPSAHIALPTC